MRKDPQILFIGGGTMAEAIIAGVSRSELTPNIVVDDVDEQRVNHLVHSYGVQRRHGANADFAKFVFLAVKPQDFSNVSTRLADQLKTDLSVVVSVMAGIPISRLQCDLNHDAVVRVMPNTPARIGSGVCAWTATGQVFEKERIYVQKMLECIGTAIYFEDEKFIDIATAVSASGPAYAFLFMEALTDAGVQLGMQYADAKRLAVGMVKGSAELAAAEDGQHLAELRNSVTSPAGTTAAALKALEAGNFRNTVIDAVVAAHRRGEQLARAE